MAINWSGGLHHAKKFEVRENEIDEKKSIEVVPLGVWILLRQRHCYRYFRITKVITKTESFRGTILCLDITNEFSILILMCIMAMGSKRHFILPIVL